MTTEHTHLQDMLASYALGALDPDEMAAVQAHLLECDSCRIELATHLETMAAMAPPEPASDELWHRIEAEVAPVPARSRWWMQAAAAVATVALAASIGVAIAQRQRISELEAIADIDRALQVALEDPATLHGTFEVGGAPAAEVVLTADGEGIFVPTGLSALDPARTYQLWVLDGELVISAGVLGADPAPSRFTWTGGTVDGFALTREVAGGVEASAGDVASVVQF